MSETGQGVGEGSGASGTDRVRHVFSSQERYVLINLAEQILELLGQSSISHDPLHDIVGISGNELPPDDPVLKRLLPSAYRELQDAAEFRRYTEDALRDRKRSHAHRIREMLLDLDGSYAIKAAAQSDSQSGIDEGMVFVSGENEVELSAINLEIVGEDVWAWLGALNDMRLALAVRLDIGGPTMGDLPNDSHRTDAPRGDEATHAQEALHRKYEVMKESDPMKAVYAVYNWLGWLQEDFLKQLDHIQDSGDQREERFPTP